MEFYSFLLGDYIPIQINLGFTWVINKVIFERTIRRLFLNLLERLIKTFPRVFSLIASIGLILCIRLIIAFLSESEKSGYAAIPFFLFTGIGLFGCVVSIIVIALTWRRTTLLDKWAHLGLAVLVIHFVIDSPGAQQQAHYPKHWANLDRGWFADYTDSRGDCPDITGVYFIQNDDVLNETFLSKNYNSYGWVSSSRTTFLRRIPWKMMQISGNANESLTVTLLRGGMKEKGSDEYSMDVTKTFLHKRFRGYRCPRQWVLSDTSPTIAEKNHVYFAKDKEDYLVAKVVDIKTGDTKYWRHYSPANLEQYNALLSKVVSSEQNSTLADEPTIEKTVPNNASASSTQEVVDVKAQAIAQSKELSEALKAKLTPILVAGVQLIGVKHHETHYIVKVLSDNKSQIASFAKKLGQIKQFSKITLVDVRENTNTVYAEFKLAQ